MKKTFTISLTFLLFLGLSEHSKGQNLLGQSEYITIKQVDSVFHSMIKAAENLDYDLISKGVVDKYNAGFIINGLYYSQYNSLISNLKSNLQSGAKQKITIQNKKISVLTKNIVLLTASGNALVELNTGQSFTTNFFWSIVFEKIENQWKVIQSHQSNS